MQNSKHSAQEDNGEAWCAFFRGHIPRLIQMALLLAADTDVAEASLMISFTLVDASRLPAADDLVMIQRVIAEHSCSLAEPGLRMAIHEQRLCCRPGYARFSGCTSTPRLCLVLCQLVGYGAECAAEILGITENTARRFLELAAADLNRICADDDARLSCG